MLEADHPGISRRASSNLYELERLREQIRAAEGREKIARNQANESLIHFYFYFFLCIFVYFILFFKKFFVFFCACVCVCVCVYVCFESYLSRF